MKAGIMEFIHSRFKNAVFHDDSAVRPQSIIPGRPWPLGRISRRLIFVVLLFLNLSCAATDRQRQYYNILKDTRRDSVHFTFMKLRNYLQEYPGSVHSREIRFAIGEYYLQVKNHQEAIRSLTAYLNDYREGEETIFAQALLYKAMLEYKEEPLLMEKIKENFFSESLFLTFSESKVKRHRSILNNTYKVVDYIDKIEIFKNNDLFLKITP